MKKGSAFEKFSKGAEKSGAAKKEFIRKEKRDFRKEREDQIADAKREKRAKFRAAGTNEPPKYNLTPPTGFQKKQRDSREGPSYKREQAPYKKEQANFRNNKSGGSYSPAHKKIELTTKRTTNRTTKPEKWDGPGPNKDRSPGPDKAPHPKPYRVENKKPYAQAEKPKQYNKDNRKPFKKSGIKSDPQRGAATYKPADNKPYKNAEPKPYNASGAKPVLQKKGLPQKVGHKDPAGDGLRPNATAKAPVSQQQNAGELMPLNKYIAHSGVCSRRDAVALIKGGKVKVNGELITEPGHKVIPSDDVRVAGRKLDPVKDFVYILLNKPKDYITTTEDPQERKTVLDLLSGAPQIRFYPVGRLDRNTSGVLLLTNDGDLSQKLTHPSNEIKKVYAVTLDKPLTKVHFGAILKGVALEDGIANVDSLAFTDAMDLTQVGVELHTGRNRVVRRIFEHFEYEVKALDRVIFAGLTKKNVTRGKWRFLTEKEVRDLKFFKKGRS